MAADALEAFEHLGVACPRDIALATFDEIPADPAFRAHVTTIVQPSYEIGSRAATMLIDRIEGKVGREPVVLRVAPRLAPRY